MRVELGRYSVDIEEIDESQGGGYVAIAVDIPAVLAFGEDPESALYNLEESIEQWLDSPI